MTQIGHEAKLELEFLESMPVDGSLRELQPDELNLAHRLHVEKKVFVVTGLWPTMMAKITYEGRKSLRVTLERMETNS